jgi:hypothetical protein
MDERIENVLSRMYNWKMTQAYVAAKEIVEFPANALELLAELSEKFGNCGWQEGVAFNELAVSNDKVADMLGYKWDDREDFYILK